MLWVTRSIFHKGRNRDFPSYIIGIYPTKKKKKTPLAPPSPTGRYILKLYTSKSSSFIISLVIEIIKTWQVHGPLLQIQFIWSTNFKAMITCIWVLFPAVILEIVQHASFLILFLWFCKRSWWRQGRTWLSITNWKRKKKQFKNDQRKESTTFSMEICMHTLACKRENSSNHFNYTSLVRWNNSI